MENFLMQRHDATCEQPETTFSFTRSSQHKALVIFAAKSSTISEISKTVLNYIFAEFDRSSLFKNFTNSLSLGELQVHDLTVRFTAEST